MSIWSSIRSWAASIGEYYAGHIYEEKNFPLMWMFKKVLAMVRLTDEHARELKELGEQGLIVYAIKDPSQLNSLILRDLAMRYDLPRPVYAHGINMIFWQPFTKAAHVVASFLAHLFLRQNILDPEENEYLKRIVIEGHPVLIHLGTSEFFRNPPAEGAIRQLIKAQEFVTRPIFICPQFITYGRRREREQESFLSILFGQTDNTGPIRRFIAFARFTNNVVVIPTEPVNLMAFIEANQGLSEKELISRLRSELINRIDEEKETIVGPALKSRDEIISMILRDEQMVQFLDDLALTERRDYDDVYREAKKYLTEIVADYSEVFIGLLDRLLTWLWNNIYDGLVIDREGLANVRNLSRRMPFVIIPCHKSHIDYLLLSYVLFKENIQLPFIAAGTNLLIWPIGYIFRKSSAFFLRRTFKGNVLYAEVFARYIKTLLKEGYPIEFFIEGGRSRTGKMVMPKFGLLSMIIQAYQEKVSDDLALVPVFIGYDRVIEEKAYLKELGGAPKTREKTSDLIKSSRFLKKRYGHVYVNIGEPIQLKQYLNLHGKPMEEMSVAERQSLYRKISYEIALAINRVSVVTPFSLVSAGLLSHDRRGIGHEELLEVVQNFFEYLTFVQARFASTFAHREQSLLEALYLMGESDLIAPIGADEKEEDDEMAEVVYSLDDEKRLNLEYYKNNILHFFLPVSFLATSILAHREDMIFLKRIMEDYNFFKNLFRHEFIFDDRLRDDEEAIPVINFLEDRGWIRRNGTVGTAGLEVTGRGRVELMHFSGLIHNYIESYWVVVRGCSYLRKSEKTERDWLKRIRQLGEKMFKKGEIQRAESLSQANYQNAIRYLLDAGVIEASEGREKGEKRTVRSYRMSDKRGALEAVRRKLFRFL
jgi:glycerol-3-phosphate O-acyltransferase